MIEKIILGIDPGLADTGWAVILASGQSYRFVSCGTISTSSKLENPERLKIIGDEIRNIVKNFTPDEASIEEVFINKNALASLKLGHARGAIIYAVATENVPIFEYSATSIKKTIVGVGRAEKHQISAMLKILIPKATPKNDHEADAIAAAICHANNSVLGRRMLVG